MFVELNSNTYWAVGDTDKRKRRALELYAQRRLQTQSKIRAEYRHITIKFIVVSAFTCLAWTMAAAIFLISVVDWMWTIVIIASVFMIMFGINFLSRHEDLRENKEMRVFLYAGLSSSNCMTTTGI